MKQKGVHAFFSGMVQGVCFRFISRELANRHRIKGWVRNLFDGRVELIAEGADEDIDNFLSDLRSEFKRHITDFQLEEVAVSGDYKDFQIRF